MRLAARPELTKEPFLRPVTVSRSKIPKLYTTDFAEKFPCITYSGAMYPLHKYLVSRMFFFIQNSRKRNKGIFEKVAIMILQCPSNN
jgi:hypothetical protein